MSTTKTRATDHKLRCISHDIHEFFRHGYFYDMLPEKLKASLDKQALELYEIQDICFKGYKKAAKMLEKIINMQYPVYATVDYFWMEDDIGSAIWLGFDELFFYTFSLCENSKDKQPLSQIYAHLGLWNKDSKHPRRQPALLKTLREKVKTLSGSEWKQLITENKVFGLLDYQNNEMRYKPVYDAVKKAAMAQFPAMKQFGETEWNIYNALFEKGNREFRIKLFLLELRLDCGIDSRSYENTTDKLIQTFIKLPKNKRVAINKLAERRMSGEKV